MKHGDSKADAAASGGVTVAISEPLSLGSGYRDYERYSVEISSGAGRAAPLERDASCVCGRVVGVLALDMEREEVVLTRQFRLGAYLSTGESDTLEIVAGRIDPGEDTEAAARRERLEELGIEAAKLVAMLELSPAPAWSEDTMTLSLASVDAREAPRHAGALREEEEILVLRYGIDQAIGLFAEKAVHSAPTIIALQWLRLTGSR